jgi:hypothetical protein
MKHLIACVLLLCPLGAAAQSPDAPTSVADCEKIKSDLAYNQCLASFGPKQGERSPHSPPDEDAQTSRSARGGTFRGSRGRQAASFSVVSGKARASRKASASSDAASPENVRARRRRR